MSTFIDGVGQCQVVDKSSELVDLKGHDITSLDKTGTVTWEHQAGTPATLVGKILKAKKIFSKEDCENDRELRYWNKCKEPYLYIMGELLDDYTASAKECAGQMRYSRDNPDQAPLLGFSIEGSEIPNTRKGMIITRSIARKVTLTQSPCNSMCVAEIFEAPEQKSKIADDFDSIFKSHEEAITLFKSGEGEKIYGDYLAKKEQYQIRPPKSPYKEYDNKGIRPGKTKGGESAFSHGHIAPYKFNPAEHQEGGEFHEHADVMSKNPKLKDNKAGRRALNSVATASDSRKENRAALSLVDKDKIALEQSKQQMAKSDKLCKVHQKSLKKDQYGYPDTPPSSPMAAPVPEPNPTNAAAVQGGAMSGGTSIVQGLERIKNAFGKSEDSGWSKKVMGDAVHFSHPSVEGPVTIQKQPSGEFHVKHNGRIAGIGGVKGSFKTPNEAGSHAKKYMNALTSNKVVPPTTQSSLSKAIEAGGYNAAPSTLTNGAAYQTESMGSRQANTGAEDHEFQATKKKDWNKQAKEDYERWPHREKFEKFMQARMPHVAMGEIKALGRALSLKKSIEFEKSLDNLIFLKPKK